jgi:ABC-type multidrug transport system ATPase subunit
MNRTRSQDAGDSPNIATTDDGEKHSRAHVAVNGVTFNVKPNEIFCLLGPNGAGKTTTMRMLTRMMIPDEGSVYLGGCNLDNPADLRRVYSFTGFCPQFDALWPLLTAQEHLQVYGILKGTPRARNGELLRSLGLSYAAKRYSKNLSGGMQRKLSVAISLLGSPRIVFMDEPSTGMDPASKRLLWALVKRETAASRAAVLLSTHSMEECEALASRVGIMVHGSMRANDTTGGLKRRFGSGSIVELSFLGESQIDAALDTMRGRFPRAAVVEHVGRRAVVDVPLSDAPLSSVFEFLETNKTQLGVSFYSVAQTSLEQIFLRFANEQAFTLTE